MTSPSRFRVYQSDRGTIPAAEGRHIMQGTISKAGVVTLGLALGQDKRESTARRFYDACARLFAGKEGKDLAKAADDLSTAGVAKKLGITQAEVKDLPENVRSAAFKSGATIARFVGYVRRFPDALPDVSLEVYATAAAGELRDAQVLMPDGKKADKGQADKDATAAIAAVVAETGEPISIRDARAAWQDTAKTRTVKTDTPETVGQRVEWLLSQETAVTEYSKEDGNKLSDLAAMIAAILK